MNIWLPLTINIVFVMILIAGMFIGNKTKGYLQIFKLLSLCGLGVGCYYLIPAFNQFLLHIPFIEKIHLSLGLNIAVLNSISFAIMFLMGYVIIAAIIGILNLLIKRDKFGVKVSNSVKIKATKGCKNFDKKPKNVLGILLGLVIAFMLCYVIMIPTKYVFREIANTNSELTQISKGYDYTVFNQIDKLIDVGELIINR